MRVLRGIHLLLGVTLLPIGGGLAACSSGSDTTSVDGGDDASADGGAKPIKDASPPKDAAKGKDAGSKDALPERDGGHDDAKTDASGSDAADASGSDAAVDSANDGHVDGSAVDGSPADAAADVTGDAPEAGAADGGADGTIGDGGTASFSVTPTALAFGSAGGKVGFVACGTSPATENFTVTASSSGPLSWWATLGQGAASPYTLSPTCTQAAPCALAAGASVTVTVTGATVPSDAGISTYDDTVTIASSASAATIPVTLSESSYGAIPAFNPTSHDFGAEPDNGSYSKSIQVTNTGNAPLVGATLSSTAGSSAEFGSSVSMLDVPLAGATFEATFDPADHAGPVSASFALGVPANTTCGGAVADLQLTGNGTQANITVSTTNLNFNAQSNQGVGVSCGSTGPTLGVTVSNSGDQSANITGLTLGLGANSPYSVLAGAPPLLVPAGGSVAVQVAPNAIPPSAFAGATFNDQLIITTDAVGDAPHVVSLEETAAGVQLWTSSTAIAFGTTALNQAAQYSWLIGNSGNVPANLAITFSNPNVFSGPGGTVVTPGAFTQMTPFTFRPQTTGPAMGTATITAAPGLPVPTCGNSTTSLSLAFSGTAVATASPYMVNPQTIQFPDVACVPNGAAVPPNNPGQPVSVFNQGTASTNFSAAISGPAAGYFSVSPTGGTLAPEAMSQLTITAVSPGSTSNLSPADVEFGLAATLTVTFGAGPTAQTFVRPFVAPLRGAYPVWSQSAVSVVAGSSSTVGLLDYAPNGDGYTFSSGSPLIVAQGNGSPRAGEPETITLQDQATGPTNTTVALVYPMGQPLCGPIPDPVEVVGN